MSLRNLRKIYGKNTLPPPEDNSDEDYEPLYAKDSSKFKYDGLVLSSESEPESEAGAHVETEIETAAVTVKKNKKKKKKQQKSKHPHKSNAVDNFDMDEIDKSVMELNAMLGVPPPVELPAEASSSNKVLHILAVQQKHLNVANEMRKLFGPEDSDQPRRRGRQHNQFRLLRKTVIVQMPENVTFQKFGLSMSISRRDDAITYFTYDHSREYQRVHKTYLRMVTGRDNDDLLPIEESQKNMHVEGILEGADSMFRMEEYTAANTLIEKIIAYMQYTAHPLFNLTDGNTRLLYIYPENRPFHIAVLKYLHLLTNRACHRTAHELAKLLLLLDPSDPLAVLFIIDTLALRAREHQWLIEAVDYWAKERDAGFLFNMQYSYAMAHFHMAQKTKGDTANSNKLLQDAMLRFPTVVKKIFECANQTLSTRLQTHELFNSVADDTTGKNLKDLIFLYAKFTWSKWREPAVLEWLTRNANELADKYDQDKQIQERAKELANERLNLFQSWPDQIVRHLSVITPMSNLLVDGAVPRVNRCRSFDPVPPANGVIRYRYDLAPRPTVSINSSALFELFSSFLPQYNVAPLEFE